MGSLRQKITTREKEIIIGTVLGDAHLARTKTSARLEIGHCEEQKELVKWKYKELKKFTGAKPYKMTRTDKRSGKDYSQRRFKTKEDRIFARLQDYFYTREGVKIIPESISSVFCSPLSLAVLFMDDGGRRNDCYGMFLNTLSFTKEEHERLQDCLEENFELETRIHWISDGHRLYIPSKEAQHFCELVSPHILPSFRYKLAYDPVTTSFAQLDRARDRS